MQGIDYDIELTKPRDDQVSVIREMDQVKYAGLLVKCVVLSKKILRQVWNCLSYIRLWQKTVKNPLYSENEIIEMQRQIGLSGSQIMKALAAKNLQK